MPRERFEPKKSAEYFAAYKDENEVYQTERIKFDAKNNHVTKQKERNNQTLKRCPQLSGRFLSIFATFCA